ncbi:MAG: 30S ribosomal protein S12 methylthiotransferase RimO [Planctomycetia bacterium]|nr:30S ribosomal protein S12 methylthiotransferase RimO [Planctomycetia bacterium]
MIKCSIISLGCPKNLVDSEQILGLLQQSSFEIELEPEEADVVIINTCGFLAASRDEGMEHIRRMEALRRDPQARLRCLIVAGCLVSRDKEALVERCEFVDVFLDVFSRDAILEAVEHVLSPSEDAPSRPTQAQRLICGRTPGIAHDTHRFPLLPPHTAYLKIAEGCNRRCSFCAIPNIRGNFTSKPMAEILDEARRLVASGVREIMLIAQETSFYGRDLADPDASLASLLRQLGRLEGEGLRWVRPMYLYPQLFEEELVDALAQTPNVVPYIDLPLQHINNRILKSMRRAVTREETLDLLERLRERIPQLAIRTAFIVGYPGETPQEFEELLSFVRKQRFPHVGVFQYSPEEGTPAATMIQVSEKVARKRAQTLMDVQRKISAQWTRSFVGKTMDVIVDMRVENGFLGRTPFDAPDIDGRVWIADAPIQPGEIYPCKFVAADEYDLFGEVVF